MGLDQEYLTAARRALVSRRVFHKVFGVGSHKTGTTSLNQIYELCGLTTGDQFAGELTSYAARRGRYQPLIDFCGTAEAFQDNPFALGRIYVALDALFPDSRFILTVRDSEDWFRSLESFTRRRHGGRVTRETLENDGYLFPGYAAETHSFAYLMEPPSYVGGERTQPVVRWDKLYDRDHYIAVYERRNQEIRDHFKGRPHQLLEIDLTREETIGKITDFLGLPAEFGRQAVPHLNATLQAAE